MPDRSAQDLALNPVWLAGRIDHTILRPDARRAELERACELARGLGCGAVCVNPIHVASARRLLDGSGVKVVAVVGFPFGATYSEVKALEAAMAVRDGADELDMVLAIGQLKDGELEAVEADIAAVGDAAAGRAVKVVLECGMLTDAEKRRACELTVHAGAALVKTSTGFLGSGATIHDVALLRASVDGSLRIKAAGGIHFYEDAVALLEAGADRLGISQTEAVLASQIAPIASAARRGNSD